ncbi:CoA pyrophosphatase [Alphaproteobacteria bacterium]|nr:CoA pyrophosphatase [Alphaproteobacteria bacterium]
MSRLSDNPARTRATALQITHLDLQQRLDACLNPLLDLSAMGLETAQVPGRPAAILVPLLRSAGHWHVLMTKRAGHLAHHAGQISFPGGKVEPDDDGPVSAALREAFEEVRLMPQLVSIAGGLDAVRSPAGFIVQPIVGIVGGDNGLDGLVADPAEVDLIFTLPLSHVINPSNFRLVPRKTNGRRNDYWVIEHEDHLIWGLSARVLKDLHRRIGMSV